MLSFEEQEKILTPILKRQSNKACADCSSISPNWASLDFGVFLCSNCSGAHRSLGPTITRVKSTKLDQWQREWVQNMRIGNEQINNYWQGLRVQAIMKKPKNGSNLNEYNKYVQDKYIRKKFIKPQVNDVDPLTKYKNLANKNQYYEQEIDNNQMQQIKKRMQKRGISQPIQIAKSQRIPNKMDNLLDDIYEQKKQEVQNQNYFNNEIHKSASNAPSNISIENDDDFTEYVSGNQNQSTDLNSQISFDQLMNQPKLQTHSSYQPQPYQQNLVHHNLVYPGHQNQFPYNSPPQKNIQPINYPQYNQNPYPYQQNYYQYQIPTLQNQKSQPPQIYHQNRSIQQTSPPSYQNFTLK